MWGSVHSFYQVGMVGGGDERVYFNKVKLIRENELYSDVVFHVREYLMNELKMYVSLKMATVCL